MFQGLNRRAAMLAAAVTVATGPFGALRAQTAPPTQYVVTYGEVAPNAEAQRSGHYLLAELTRLARSSGAQYFSVNTEVDRPNRFTLVQVWRDAAAYSAFSGASNVQQTFAYLQPLLLAPLDARLGNLVVASQPN